MEFEGDLSEKHSLTFKAEGIYFARKDNRIVTLNLENNIVEENYYGIVILPKEEIR